MPSPEVVAALAWTFKRRNIPPAPLVGDTIVSSSLIGLGRRRWRNIRSRSISSRWPTCEEVAIASRSSKSAPVVMAMSLLGRGKCV